MVEVLSLVVLPETTDFYVTALQGRSADDPGVSIRSVTKVDALPPSFLTYTLDDGNQFAIVDDGEPHKMQMCIDMDKGPDQS
ncbi:hypothetical protein B0G81_2197 [Paraburkholderia sp. BL6665CI2N2]|uniref:hypothetical protein n=1 Tax=Paraburkholderia sp. BL6665CI2N2 TaxID=1938806 RepID=UPI0010651404|nr:hypothetical protein [Paraburkholderia sp. BL6665CI2N2]TDY21954.1 hypothetical protein B0G81_2197 [Paraburkholderia sp. BL6665CI2N2]